MRCFYHEDREAVGGCRSCSKGLCSECAVDLTKGLACRDRCEGDVRALIQLTDRNIQISGTSVQLARSSRGIRLGSGLFHIVIGILFLGLGLSSGAFQFAAVVGLGLLAYGGYLMFLGMRLKSD